MLMLRSFSATISLALALLLAGCSTLPGSGPSRRKAAKESDEEPREYAVIQLDVAASS